MFRICFHDGLYLSRASISLTRPILHYVESERAALEMPRFQAVEMLRHVRCHGFRCWLVPA
jgi:hypothetical protein